MLSLAKTWQEMPPGQEERGVSKGQRVQQGTLLSSSSFLTSWCTDLTQVKVCFVLQTLSLSYFCMSAKPVQN